MTPKTQGIFLFYEWMDALEKLPPKTAMTILQNMARYGRDDVEPPPMRGCGGLVQSVMLSQAKRQKQAAVYGRKGAEAKRARALPTEPNDPNEDADMMPTTAGRRLTE